MAWISEKPFTLYVIVRLLGVNATRKRLAENADPFMQLFSDVDSNSLTACPAPRRHAIVHNSGSSRHDREAMALLEEEFQQAPFAPIDVPRL